jgi:hypothetical protein
MSKTKPIYHHNRQILFLDFSGCSVNDFFIILEESKKLIREQPLNSVLTLTDVTNARYNSEVIQALKEFTKGNKPFVRAGAVVGLDGLTRIIYNSVMYFSGRNITAFDDIGKAKDWLVEQWKASSNAAMNLSSSRKDDAIP